MRCASCDHDNRDGAKFCEECAAPLKRGCASCGAEVRPAAKFCDECGAPLPGTGNGVRGTGQQIPGAPSAEPRETRKVISVVFADLMGSTALQERLDPESVNRVMDAYYDSVRGPVEAAGGTVVQLLGDGVLCAFGIPQIGEDDALRAVRAAVGVQQAFRDFVQAQQWLTVPIGLRVAVNTGEVVVSDEHPAGIGDPLNVAARLQQEARDGEVLIGPATRRLVAEAVTLERAGVFTLKGRAETVTAYRVLSLERPTGTAAAPFVGRDDELARLKAIYETARTTPAARLAVLLGSPGLGKSRLIAEVTRRAGDAATVVTARCDAVGGATFAPVAEALRELLGSDVSDSSDTSEIEALLSDSEADRTRIAKGICALLGGDPASPEETFFVIRRFLAALARQKPVVLVIDDLQWAEPLLLDLVEHLVQWGSGVPLFVLVGARPELRDLRSSLVTPGGLVSEVMTLSGLDAGAAMRLAANVIGAADLPAAVAAKVLATSEGNPLFVGELVRMLVDEGAIERQGERWIVGANLAALEMPPTIHALLAARIERLKPDERAVLERAAVVGRHFSRSAVAALLGHNGNELDALLEALRRTELIEPDRGWFLGEPVLRFHHVLIRDAAYRRLLKGTRVELHERLADWIEERVKDAAEQDETIGWHLEQAHQLLRELGPLDSNGRALGERAAKRLAAAGRSALARDDVPVAADLLGRAIDRLDAEDPARADLLLDWCEALLSAGDVGNAARAIAELAHFTTPLSPQASSPSPPATGLDRLRAWHTCFAGQLTVMTAPQELQATAEAVAQAAEQFAALGDSAGEAKAHSVHAQALARLGRVGACEAALDRALAAARKAGDRRRANAVLAGAPLAALWGPSPVTRASGRCLDVVRVLRITQGAPAVEATALSCQGVLEALRGRTDAARRMIASSRKMVEELGIAHRLLEADVFAGRIDLLEGDASGAEHHLRGAYEGLRELGLGIDAARAGALLGRALLAQDRGEEADAVSRESEALAGDDLQAAIAWRGVRAQALAQRGEHAAAIELAQAAVAIAAATDALLDHADARLALAAALRAAGRSDDADREEHRAVELWEAKGASLLAERARSPVKAVTRQPASPEKPAGMKATVERRIRPNAVRAISSRWEVAFAARDVEALIALHSEDLRQLDHPSGASYGHAGAAVSIRKLLSAENPWMRVEPLATLGESLELARRWIGASGGGRFGVGPYDREEVTICEADARGRIQYVESFAPDRLGDAVVRLYECYAESLPAGAERERAVATARAMGVVTAEVDIDELAAVISPGFESVDHRPLSTWSQRGGEAFVEHIRALQEVADDIVMPVIDVLALEPHAVLIRRMHSGTERVGGGSYERPHLGIFVTGADGRLERYEIFDDDCQAEALARFDEIAGPNAAPSREHSLRRRVQTNAATRAIDRFNAAIAARDMEAVAATYSDKMEVLYHPTGATYGKEADVATWRRFFGASRLAVRHTPIATLGDSLVLLHEAVSHAGIELKNGTSVGPVEVDRFVVYQVGEDGRTVRSEVFDTKHLGDAIARLYEGQAALNAEGPERDRLATIARVYRLTGSALKIDTIVPELFAPDAECSDHRTLATWSARGAGAIVQQVRGIYDVASEFELRDDDVLALDANAVLTRRVHAGTERLGGGNYERVFLSLFAFAADGRIKNVEMYDVDREAEALARFDELTTAAESRRPVRRIRPNTAARSVERFRAALVDGDWDTVEAVVPPHCEVVWHPTGSTFSGAESVASFRPLLKAHNLALRDQTLATLGDFLALTLRVVSYEGLDTRHGPVGPVEVVHTEVLEVDEQGRARRSENFATDHLGDAIARLYERHAELQSAGPERERAAMTARSVRAMLTPFDLGRDSPDIVQVDHRVLGNWGARGSASVREQVRALHEVAEDAAVRDDAVLALEPTALLVQRTHFGTERLGGGVYETPHLVLMGFGGDGRLARVEFFDLGKEAEALARFAELVDGHRPDRQRAAAEGSPTGAGPAFANTATRLNERFVAACDERDWEGLEALHAPSHHYDDRRRLMHLRTSVDLSMAGFRVLLEVPGNRWIVTPLATRGDRLVLSRVTLEGEAGAGGGPVAIDYLVVDEIDDSGRFAETVLFDPDDLDAAYAELDRRWQAGEARAHTAAKFFTDWARCFAERDWDGMSSLFAPDVVSKNHRMAGWGTIDGAPAQVSTHQSLVELAADAQVRVEHVRTSERAVISHCTWHGTHDGGLFESSWVVVGELNDRGQMQRIEAWDDHRADEALAHFTELAGGDAVQSSQRIFANAASRIPEQIARAWATGDWQTLKAAHDALHSPTHHYDDRRKLVRIRTPLETSMEGLRFLFDVPKSRFIATTLATRGERLALTHLRFEGDVEAGGGALELEMLAVGEVDAQGRCETESILFDTDDLDSAYAELDARFAAGEGLAHPLALAAHRASQTAGYAEDWSGFAALHASGFEYRDHRLLGWGTMDLESLVRALQSLFELAADARYRHDHLRLCSRGSLRQMTVIGTHDGGAFEIPLLAVTEVDENGKIRRMDTYDVEDHDRALAHFDAIRRGEPDGAPTAGERNPLPESVLMSAQDQDSDPLAAVARPNSAFATVERWRRTYSTSSQTGEWNSLQALHAPDMVFEDRRRHCLLAGGLDLMMASSRERAAIGARATSRLVSTAGDRICVFHLIWAGGPADAPYEIEYLTLAEIGEDQRLTAVFNFDSDDPFAAQREAWKRWAAIEPELAETLATVAEGQEAFTAQDRTRLQARLDPDLVVEDRRHAGMGRIEGAAAYADSLAALWQLAPNTRLELGWFWPAIGPRGGIFTVRRSGEISGGGDYESVYLALLVHAANQWKRLEMFELDDIDIALARFVEVQWAERGPSRPVIELRSPKAAPAFENAASTAWGEAARVWEEGEPGVFAKLATPDYRYRDRRRLFRMDLALDEYVRFARLCKEMKGRNTMLELLGSAGDHLALMRMMAVVEDGDFGANTMESLVLIETDEQAKISAQTRFDPEDERAAFQLLDRRFSDREKARNPAAARFLRAFRDTLDRRAWDEMLALLDGEITGHDHRLVSWDTLRGGERFLASMQSMTNLVPNVVAMLRHSRIVGRALLGEAVWLGERDGGAFESPFVCVIELNEEGKALRLDLYEAHQLERAFERFEEIVAWAAPPPLPGEAGKQAESTPDVAREGGAATRRRDPPRSNRARLATIPVPSLPENAALRSLEDCRRLWESRDFAGVREKAAPDFRYEDRGKRALVEGDIETWIKSMQFWPAGTEVEVNAIATVGDRISLDHARWWSEAGGDAFEIERIRLFEVDDQGRPCAAIHFDLDDRKAAFAEANARFARGEAAVSPGQAVLASSFRALAIKDWKTFRALLADDFVHRDHRTLGLGSLDPDTWIESLQALSDLTSELTFEPIRSLVWNRHGDVRLGRQVGEVTGGGAFENLLVVLQMTDGQQICRVEIFDSDTADRAIARFEELCREREKA